MLRKCRAICNSRCMYTMEMLSLVDLSLCIPLVMLLVWAYFLLSRRMHPKLKLPPGPQRWPIFGNLLQLSHLPHRDMARFSAAFGALVYLRLGVVDAITTDDPDVIREMLLRQDDIFASRPQMIAANHLAYGYGDVVWAPFGPRWRRLRRICVEHLLTTKRIESFADHRTTEVRQLLCDVHAGEPVDLRKLLGAFSMNNVTRMLLGKRFFGPEKAGPEEAAKFLHINEELFRLLGRIYLGDYLPLWKWIDPLVSGYERNIREVEQKMDKFHQKILDEHRQAVERRREAGKDMGEDVTMDFVNVLLSLRSEDGTGHMTDVEIKALMQDMVAAATDTTSVTIEWAMAEAIKNPDVMTKVQEELDRVVGRDRVVEESDLRKLTYLRCVVRETFRLHPTAPFLVPHESTRATKLMGFDIPAKTVVFINTHSLGRNTRVWGSDVDEFRPERHLPVEGGRVEFDHGADFKILPFGSGKRRCPGALMGATMVLLALATLFHGFDWSPFGEIDTAEAFGLTMPKAKPLLAVARRRLAPCQFVDNRHD